MLGELPSSSTLSLSEYLGLLEVFVPLSPMPSHLVLLPGSRLEASCNANVNVGGHHKPGEKSQVSKSLDQIQIQIVTQNSVQLLSDRVTGRRRSVSGSDSHTPSRKPGV